MTTALFFTRYHHDASNHTFAASHESRCSPSSPEYTGMMQVTCTGFEVQYQSATIDLLARWWFINSVLYLRLNATFPSYSARGIAQCDVSFLPLAPFDVPLLYTFPYNVTCNYATVASVKIGTFNFMPSSTSLTLSIAPDHINYDDELWFANTVIDTTLTLI